MSTQITIDESGAEQVVVVAEGVPGGDGIPGAGLSATTRVALPAGGTITATANTLHTVDVAGGAVTVLLPAGTEPGTHVGVVRYNSDPGPLIDFVAVQAGQGASLHGDPVGLYGDGQSVVFIHAGSDAWWLVGSGDLPNPLDGVNFPAFGPARRDQNGRVQGPDPAADGDYATRGWVNARNSVGLRVNGYVGYSPGKAVAQSTPLYGNVLSNSADAGSFIPSRDCVAELDLVVHLQTFGSSAGQFRLDVNTPNGTYSIVNTQRFHFHGDIGTKMFPIRGVSNPLYAGQRVWFLLYAGMDPATSATTCLEVDYQYVERS